MRLFLKFECAILLKSTLLNAESRCISVAEWLKRMVSAGGIFMSAWVQSQTGSLFLFTLISVSSNPDSLTFFYWILVLQG